MVIIDRVWTMDELQVGLTLQHHAYGWMVYNQHKVVLGWNWEFRGNRGSGFLEGRSKIQPKDRRHSNNFGTNLETKVPVSADQGFPKDPMK